MCGKFFWNRLDKHHKKGYKPYKKDVKYGQNIKKTETFQILRNSGKSLHEAYKMAGFKGNSVSSPYKLEGKVKQHALTDPKLLKISKKVAKHILEIAEDALKGRKDDPAIQTLCVKAAMQIIRRPARQD